MVRESNVASVQANAMMAGGCATSDDGINIRMGGVNLLMQQHGTAGHLARLAHAVLYANQVFRLDVFAILQYVGGDYEGDRPDRRIERRALGGVEQILVVAAMDHLGHIAAHGALLGGRRSLDELVQSRMYAIRILHDLIGGQLGNFAQAAGVYLKTAGVIQRLERHERVEQILRAAHNAVCSPALRCCSP